MHIRLSLLVLFLSASAFAQAPTTAPTSQPISGKLGTPIDLFNGKDFSGWTWYAQTGGKMEDTWSIKDGAMHMTGKPTGYIRTDKEYGPNYILIVEQRHIERGGGGILFGITGPDKEWPKTMQVQGSLGSVGDLINQGSFPWVTDPSRFRKDADGVTTRVTKIGPTSEKPMGEFSTVETIVDHGTVTVKVNDKIQNIVSGMPDLTGKIGFQAEGAAMEFRKVRLIPIEPK
jgi:hypothetical protein